MKKTKDTLSVDVFTDLLKQNLPKVHKARLRAVALFVLSLISEATVNLQKLALSGLASVQPDSVYKRFHRLLFWLASAKIDFAELILKLAPPFQAGSSFYAWTGRIGSMARGISTLQDKVTGPNTDTL